MKHQGAKSTGDGSIAPVNVIGRLKERIVHRLDPRLAAELATQRRPILIGLACTAVAATFEALTVLLAQQATKTIQELAPSKKPHSIAIAWLHLPAMPALLALCGLVILLFGAKYWFTRGQSFYLGEAANRLAMNLRIRMMQKLLRLPVGYYNDRRAGAIQSVLTNDVNVYQTAVGLIRDSIQAPITSIGAFTAILILQWQLAIVALLLIPAMVVVMQRNARRMRRAQTEIQGRLANVSATMLEVLSGTRVVKAFGAEDRVQDEYDRTVQQTFESQTRALHVVSALRPLQDLIGAVGIAVFLYLCGILARVGTLDVSHVVALGVAMDKVNQGLKSLGGAGNTYAMVQAASERIHSEILDVPESKEFEGGRCLAHPEGNIAFENVSFTYPDGTYALDNVSFEIQPGTSLALVGPSGSGKSTIADLLLRFYDPTSGRILFDGVDLRDLDVRWLRLQIGPVPQHTFLFAGSIEDNVKLGDPYASDEDVRTALRLAHAEEFAADMRNRTNAELGERGVRLSGGQMQRVAIARALVRKPTVLLLDEATSALDAASEKAVTEALAEVMQTRTTLFIAHRLTTAARADRILVLNRGQVMEVGSHTELMEANGSYASLFRAFSGGVLV